MEHLSITVIILTHNEEKNITDCLMSVAQADEVILVDSGSTDATLDTAQRIRSDTKVFTHPFQDFGDQRNWALEHTNPRNEWILFLDADERCNEACASAIQKALASDQPFVGYYLAPRNYFQGQWLKRSTLYPSWQLRLLKKGHVQYRKEGHGQREVTKGPLGYIHAPYDHYGFSKGLDAWKARHEVYAAEEVGLIQRLRDEPLAPQDLFSGNPITKRRCLKRLAARVGFRPFFRFVYLYILRGGFLDGRAGWIFCMLRVDHEKNIEKKLREVTRGTT